VKQKAIFLDRDGVLNRELGRYVCSVDEFEILPHIVNNLLKLRDAGYQLIVITNQGGIAKGLYTEKMLYDIHQKLKAELATYDVILTDIFYCPHHPDFGKCLCRKPAPLMLQKAIAKHQIDLSSSWMIGDTDRDVQAAKAAGVRSHLIQSNADWSYWVDAII
jgi:D-glycero-D-manno-heptose 1,7-bisphosphate phosphatase